MANFNNKAERMSLSFVRTPASISNTLEIFDDWVCKVPAPGKSGTMMLFDAQDVRPQQVVDTFGSVAGWKILDIGSFEAPHTYQFERMGADVTGIEANPDLFLKSLLVKNATGLKAQFLLGDFTLYLTGTAERYDLIFASGVIYHMRDPIELLYQMAMITDRVFIWGHYVSADIANGWNAELVTTSTTRGFTCPFYKYVYHADAPSRPFSGTEEYCSRIAKEDIIAALKEFGFTNVITVADDPNHGGGPAVTLIAHR